MYFDKGSVSGEGKSEWGARVKGKRGGEHGTWRCVWSGCLVC